jgi:hypothetical protein
MEAGYGRFAVNGDGMKERRQNGKGGEEGD